MHIGVRCPDIGGLRIVQEALAAAEIPATGAVGAASPDRTFDVVILDGRPEAHSWARAIAPSFARQGRALVAAATFDHPPPDDLGTDASIILDGPAELLARDLNDARRAATVRAERLRRSETAAALGYAAMDLPPAESPRTLFVGEPHPFFLALEEAHRARGAHLEAVFTTFMGFDALHDAPFDALVLNAGRDPATALSLCGALRRNAQLHHLPVVMLTAAGDAATPTEAISRGAAMVATGGGGALSAWLFHKIAVSRRRTADLAVLEILRSIAKGDGDLFERPFFDAHLQRLVAEAHASMQPLSLTVLRRTAADEDESVLNDNLRAMAQLVGRIVRATDVPCLIGDRVVVAFPATDGRGAGVAARRAAAVAECTAFGSAGVATIDSATVELAQGESAEALLRRALDPFVGYAHAVRRS